jgi:hypothetical protein
MARRSTVVARKTSSSSQLEGRGVGSLGPLDPHHGDEEGGQVERPHHAVDERALAALGGADAELVEGGQHDGALSGHIAGAQGGEQLGRRLGRAGARVGRCCPRRPWRGGRRHRGGEAEAAVEQVVEEGPVLVALHQAGGQQLAQQRAVGEIDVAQRVGGVEDLAHRHAHAGGAQLLEQHEEHGEHGVPGGRRHSGSVRAARGPKSRSRRA